MSAGCREIVCWLLLYVVASVRAQSGCMDCSSVGTASCDGSQCVCLPGVTGRLCDVCVPGYTGLSILGCSECDCDPVGSADLACSTEGLCECRPRISGDKCDRCSVGYHMFSRGCLTCPPCFAGIPGLYSTALELLQLLQSQLNFTLEGGTVGVSPALLAMLREYERTLQDLLQRVKAALMREQFLTTEEERLSGVASQLQLSVDRFQSNVTSAEMELTTLIERLNMRQEEYDLLLPQIQELRDRLLQELRQLMEQAVALNDELFAKIQRLQDIASSVNATSFLLEEEASTLHAEALMTLSEARSYFRRLLMATSLHEKSVEALNEIETFLISVEDLTTLGEESLLNLSMTVPDTLEEARRALKDVRALSSLDIDFNSTSNTLDTLNEEVSRAKTSTDAVSATLLDLNDEFLQLNESAVSLLEESRDINNEAELLLERANFFFNQTETGVREVDSIVQETDCLLRKLQNSSRDVDQLVEGLQSVIDNVERAEKSSDMAVSEARINEVLVMQLQRDVSEVVMYLETAQKNLQETSSVSNILNVTVEELLRNSSALRNGTDDLAQDISALEGVITELERSAEEDQEIIAMVIATANETILRSEGVEERVRTANRVLANLTQLFNETSLLPRGRLEQVLSVLTSLEASADLNQEEVERLSEEVKRLQESANALRRSYTSLRQHRDLLQKMLSNVEKLDCTDQFLT